MPPTWRRRRLRVASFPTWFSPVHVPPRQPRAAGFSYEARPRPAAGGWARLALRRGCASATRSDKLARLDHSRAANNMLYDVTILAVRPGGTPKSLPQLNAWITANKGRGELLACWYTEIGTLNRVLVIRGYADEASLGADRAALAAREDCFGVGDLLSGVETDTYVSLPFIEPIKAGSYGPVYEVRTYLLKPGGLAGTTEAWRKTGAGRMKLRR